MHWVRHFAKVKVMPTSGRNNLYFKIKSLFKSFPVISTKGFTLIELLIVVAITGVLSTVILANFNSFGARQEVRNTAEEFKTELRKYQIFAIAAQKNPDQGVTCTSTDVLQFYQIEIDDTTTPAEYTVSVHCDGPIISLPTKKFPENITVDASSICSGNLIIRFLPLNQGAEICPGSSPTVSSADIKFSRGGTEYFVKVTDAGEIQVHR